MLIQLSIPCSGRRNKEKSVCVILYIKGMYICLDVHDDVCGRSVESLSVKMKEEFLKGNTLEHR